MTTLLFSWDLDSVLSGLFHCFIEENLFKGTFHNFLYVYYGNNCHSKKCVSYIYDTKLTFMIQFSLFKKKNHLSLTSSHIT